MKIVHLCLTGGYTEGLNYQENYLTKYQALEGFEVTVITTQYCWNQNTWGQSEDSDYKNEYGVRVIRIPYKYKIPYRLNTYIGKFAGLYDILCTINPNIIFIHNLQFQDIALVKKYKEKNTDVRIIADSHSDFSNSARGWISKNLLYKIYWRSVAKQIIPVTETFYGVLPARVDFLQNIFKIPAEKTALLVLGADDEKAQAVIRDREKKRFRTQFGIGDEDFLIVTGGKIDSFKLQTLLLMEAIHDLNRKNVRLCVFGSVEDEIKSKFDSLCDGWSVQYIGWAKGDQSYDYFAEADLVVFPGRHSVYWEQAAGMGIPMVCKYWEGTTHVDLGGNVIFLYKDSADEIRNVIEQVLDVPGKYESMLNVAKNDAAKKFSYENIARLSIE